MKSTRRAAGGAIGVSWLCAIVACGTDDDTSRIIGRAEVEAPASDGAGAAARCVPGQTLGCMGVCGQPLAGYQVCAADGLSYGECVCPPASPLASFPGEWSGTSISGFPRFEPSMGMSGGPFADTPVVGAPCRVDADCGGGLECFAGDTDSLGVGGPAGGYCTTACSDNEGCRAVDPAAACGTLAGQDLCMRVCRSQELAAGETKCLERDDLTCVSLAALGEEDLPPAAARLGICVPQCQSDAACPGRRCDLDTGLCTSAPARGAPIGAPCREPSECAGGICLAPAEETAAFCSAFCTLGVAGCGADGSGICLLPQVPGEGAGDRGVCFEPCASVLDCLAPGSLCVPGPEGSGVNVCVRPLVPVEPEPEPAVDESIGAECEVDSDCEVGLTCLRSAGDPFDVGGGPAGGYCSRPCESQSDCLSAGSACIVTPGGGYCLRACDLAAEQGCGRDTLTCAALGPRAFCQPACNADAECGERRCDPELRLCVDAPECASDADCEEGSCDLETSECVSAQAPLPQPPAAGG